MAVQGRRAATQAAPGRCSKSNRERGGDTKQRTINFRQRLEQRQGDDKARRKEESRLCQEFTARHAPCALLTRAFLLQGGSMFQCPSSSASKPCETPSVAHRATKPPLFSQATSPTWTHSDKHQRGTAVFLLLQMRVHLGSCPVARAAALPCTWLIQK